MVMRPRLLSDLRLMRSKNVSDWYGDVMGAWESLHSSADDSSPAHWRNLGYWNDRSETFDQACRNLATKLADAAQVRPGCDVLDVGCGLGASTFLLRERLDNGADSLRGRLVGLDITAQHIRAALARRKDDRPEFMVGSATELPFENDSFDRVLALECAFHFPDRRKFFAEALRVLRPGGVLGLADVLIAQRSAVIRQRMNRVTPPGIRTRVDRITADILKTPTENLVALPEYLDQLHAAGFVDPTSENISDRVFPYFIQHWRRANDLAAQESVLRFSGVDPALARQHASAWRLQMRIFMFSWPMSDYVIVAAYRPKC